ncbi:hypothetical protein C8T65DRAFT_524116, partial [Cerioporus squamosus]
DPTFWFFDGNIVLVTPWLPVAFRVHKGVLALHSKVFADMFQSAQEPSPPHDVDDEERMEGCPVIPLRDSAYDIRQLLKLVMYGQRYVVYQIFFRRNLLIFPSIAALIRFGDKYDVHNIVEECKPHLIRMVPTTFRDYERANSYRGTIEFAPYHALEALNVFRLIDLGPENRRIISFMLFLCTQLTEAQIRNGTARADFTLERLSDGDMERVLALRAEL